MMILHAMPEVPVSLQVEPEFRASAEEMPQAQGRISGHAALAVQDFSYTVRRHLELARQRRRAHIQRFKLFGEMFARVYGPAFHDAPQW